MFLVNSRYPLVCASLASSDRKGHHQKGTSFFRSYGGNLPSSLTIVLPIALVFSTRPPVSVWGTGTVPTHCWAFLGSMESVDSTKESLYHISEFTVPTLIGTLLRAYPGNYHRPGSPILLRPPSATRQPLGEIASRRKQPPRCNSWAWRGHGGHWNINQLCIGYASRPRLSSRLTLGGLAFPRNPWAFGGGVSHPSLATHACILTR